VTAARLGQTPDPVAAIGSLINKKLDEDRKQCLESIQRTEDLPWQSLDGCIQQIHRTDTVTAHHQNGLPVIVVTTLFATTLEVECIEGIPRPLPDDESDTDSDESPMCKHNLPPESFNEGRSGGKHICDYNWTEAGKKVLGSLLENERPLRERVKSRVPLVKLMTVLAPDLTIAFFDGM